VLVILLTGLATISAAVLVFCGVGWFVENGYLRSV
jgi:hypothetical protein